MSFLYSPWFWWLTASILLMVIESISGTTIAFSLAAGCIIAMLASFFEMPFSLQIIIALIAAVIVFIAFFAIPNIRNRKKDNAYVDSGSNMDAIIGRNVSVIEEITANKPGRVKIDGDIWQAVSTDGQIKAVGSIVEVKGYDSIILRVE